MSLPLRRDPAFVRFWLSRTISALGSGMSIVALPLLVYERTHSAVLVALVSAAGTLPYLMFGLIAGAVADRVDRRRLLVACDLLCMVCIAIVPTAVGLGMLSGALVVVAAMASSTFALFFDAGSYGLVPDLVGKGKLGAANSSLYAAETTARVSGTALAGLLAALIGTSNTLIVDAASFGVSAALVASLKFGQRPLSQDRPRLTSSIREGLVFLAGHSVLRMMTLVGTMLSFAGGAIVGQLVIFADRGLHLAAGDARIGLLYTAWSAGGVLGSIVLARILRVTGEMQVLLIFLPVTAVLAGSVVLASSWLSAILLLLLWASAYIILLVNTMTYSQSVTPSHMQGRVNTTRRMISSGLGVPLGSFVGSLVTSARSIRAGMSLSVLATGLAAVYVWTTHLLRSRA